MKVLHVIPSVSSAHGGPSTALYLMARALADAGVSVTVATTDDDGVGRRRLANCVASEIRAPYETRRFPKQSEFYKFSTPLFRWLVAHVREYDLVHVHAMFSFPSVAGAWVARSRSVPYLIRPIGVLERYGLSKRRPRLKALSLRVIEGPLLRDAAAVQFTSATERDQAQELGLKMSSVVIPLGVEVCSAGDPEALLKRYPFTRERRRVLFLSRIDPKKNLEGLIGALAMLARRGEGPVLFVAGTGIEGYVESLRALATKMGIADSIVWLGHLSGEDKAAALAAAELFVLPSFSENFGLAAAEALAAGIPCVLGRGVAIAEDVTAAGAGIAVDPTPEAIADGVTFFLRDEARRAAASSAARRLAEQRYSTRRMGEELVALYERCVLDHKSRDA